MPPVVNRNGVTNGHIRQVDEDEGVKQTKAAQEGTIEFYEEEEEIE